MSSRLPASRLTLLFSLLLVGQLGLAWFGSPRTAPLASLACWSLAGTGWALLVRELLRGRTLSLPMLLAAGVALRLVALGAEPSDDVNRYVWEGRVLLAGADPYRLAPNAPELAELARLAPEHAAVNHPDWTAIYPPLALGLHAALAAVSPTPAAFRIAFLLCEALLVMLLLAELRRRGLPDSRLAIYLLSPLAIFATAHEGHHEVVGATLLLAALQAARAGAPLASGALGALCLMSRTTLGYVLLALWPPGPRSASARLVLLLAAALSALALWWPFADSGLALLASLRRFGAEMHFNDALPALLRAALGPGAALPALAVLALGFALAVLLRGPRDAHARAAWLLGGLTLLAPTVHPWYLLPMLALLAVFPWWGWLSLSLTVALPWWALSETLASGAWVEWPLLKVPEYAPLVAWLGVCLWRRSFPSRLGAS